jgi:hypothetical protein
VFSIDFGCASICILFGISQIFGCRLKSQNVKLLSKLAQLKVAGLRTEFSPVAVSVRSWLPRTAYQSSSQRQQGRVWPAID